MPLLSTERGLGGAGVGASGFGLLHSCRLSFPGKIHASAKQISVLCVHVYFVTGIAAIAFFVVRIFKVEAEHLYRWGE